MVKHKIKKRSIRQNGHNGIKKKIEEVMKGNDWMDQVGVANKIHLPVLEVDKALIELQKEGLVDVRPAK